MDDQIVFRLAPYQYTHVLDNNTNISRIAVGPQVLIKQNHEEILHKAPLHMIVIPPSHYCIIANPVMTDPSTGKVITDKFGQAKLHNGDKEYRFEQDPFPLYPGEYVQKEPTKMEIVLQKEALQLKAIVDFTDENSQLRPAGSEWYFEGPGTYKPRKEVERLAIVKSINVASYTALLIKALRDCIDAYGNKRVSGEQWLIREIGDYLPSIEEEFVQRVNGIILNEDKAIHVKAVANHKDEFGINRKAGDEWLISHENTDCYIPDVNELIIKEVKPVILKSTNYCMILNPVDALGKCRIGTKKVIRGPQSFFLHPGEELDDNVMDIYQLTVNDGLVLRCVNQMEGKKVGDMWLISGPCEFVPTETVEIVHVRKAISMAENEGIYVKNMNTGIVRSVIGGNYMLTEEEELWRKFLPKDVRDLLDVDAMAERSVQRSVSSQEQIRVRMEHEVVSYRIPHNAACQVYDYKLKKARVIFGPELVLLAPDEQFTLLSLSEGVPKKHNARKAICLLLGPDYFEEMFTIETADHARLSLRVSLNWQFDLEDKTEEEKRRIFALPDFIGDVCKVVSSRIRGAVSSIPFDHFHKNSATMIHKAVFGTEYDRAVESSITFQQNFLKITSLDIISLEPIDQKTRDALQRTVQLAIEITTNAQEANAKHEAVRLKQEADSRQARQRLIDEIAAEEERNKLIRQKIHNIELETCGQAVADAKSQAEAMRIERQSAVEQANLEIEALKIRALHEIEQMQQIKRVDLEYTKDKNLLDLERMEKQAQIEVNKFQNQVAAIGKEAIVAMANAGPELKVRMLQALGLQSALITDGSNPINLFNTAAGLVEHVPTNLPLCSAPLKRRQDPPGQ